MRNQSMNRYNREDAMANRWSPLTEFRTEFDRLFDDFLGSNETSSPAKRGSDWLPVCDIQEAEGHFLVSLEVPGISKDQIKLEVVDHRLRVSGERKSDTKTEKEGRWYSERSYGRFERSFALPENVDADRLEAHFENGILQVYIPKAELAKPREIKIQQGSGSGLFERLLGKTNSSTESNERH
jgi:HSP20 family protein